MDTDVKDGFDSDTTYCELFEQNESLDFTSALERNESYNTGLNEGDSNLINLCAILTNDQFLSSSDNLKSMKVSNGSPQKILENKEDLVEDIRGIKSSLKDCDQNVDRENKRPQGVEVSEASSVSESKVGRRNNNWFNSEMQVTKENKKIDKAPELSQTSFFKDDAEVVNKIDKPELDLVEGKELVQVESVWSNYKVLRKRNIKMTCWSKYPMQMRRDRGCKKTPRNCSKNDEVPKNRKESKVDNERNKKELRQNKAEELSLVFESLDESSACKENSFCEIIKATPRFQDDDSQTLVTEAKCQNEETSKKEEKEAKRLSSPIEHSFGELAISNKTEDEVFEATKECDAHTPSKRIKICENEQNEIKSSLLINASLIEGIKDDGKLKDEQKSANVILLSLDPSLKKRKKTLGAKGRKVKKVGRTQSLITKYSFSSFNNDNSSPIEKISVDEVAAFLDKCKGDFLSTLEMKKQEIHEKRKSYTFSGSTGSTNCGMSPKKENENMQFLDFMSKKYRALNNLL